MINPLICNSISIFLFYIRQLTETSHKRIRDEAEKNYLHTAGMILELICNSLIFLK
jgi:hypothetical protein